MGRDPNSRMSVDAFLAWPGGRDGRYELVDGAAVAMSPQTVGHARAKYRVHAALARALAMSGLPCDTLSGRFFPESVSPACAARERSRNPHREAINRISYEMIPDGVTVRVDAHTAFEPDALVQCDDRLPDAAVEAASPILVVEVLSPSTKRIDTGRKLEGYFRVPSIVHYLIVDPERPMVIHHRRGEAGAIETRIVSAGMLRIDPPGVSLDVSDLFGEVQP